MRVIDLTHTMRNGMPVYPGTEPPVLEAANSYEKDGFKETLLSFYSHTGTHMDPPAHLRADGRTLDSFPAEQFVGMALVIDCRSLGEGEAITVKQLAPYGEKVGKADFLLFCTGWDKRWGTESYFGNYPCVDEEVLSLIIGGGYKGIGFDVIGLDPVGDASLTRHNKLFAEAEMVNIENLKDLELCGSDLFRFVCLPLKWSESDGAPIRAVALLDD